MTTDLVFSTTTQLASAIQSRRVTAQDVVDAHLAQIERHNPTLNAIVTLDATGARQRAQEADAALARGELWGPLHGVPFTLKDCHATEDMRTTAGYLPLADHVPDSDGTVSRRLKAAGGILMGKTNVSVMLADIQTDNAIFGRTNNPWRLDRTPGGSSGGAAAALAAGLTPFDIGSDIGGSIRIPSHFCGVFGLKPTENRVPSTGHIPDPPGAPRAVRLMASIGPMARSVEDLALLFGLIAGPDGRDMETPPVPVAAPPPIALHELRIAAAATFPGFPVARAVADTLQELAERLAPRSAAISYSALPGGDFERQLLRARELTGMMVEAYQAKPEGTMVSAADYLLALHHRDEAIVAWERFFLEWDVLICPASMVPAFPHCASEAPLDVDGRTVDYWWANAHCKLFNYTGHPAIVLPFEQDGEGLPIGVQVVGKRWDEARLLAIAQALTQVTGAFQKPDLS